jgi:hypothetical protein
LLPPVPLSDRGIDLYVKPSEYRQTFAADEDLVLVWVPQGASWLCCCTAWAERTGNGGSTDVQ